MKNDENKEQIMDLAVNTIFILDLQMSDNYNSVGFGMQQFKDDMLGASTKSTVIFVQLLGIFVQSLELWAQSTNKLVQSKDVFSQSTNKWAQLAKAVYGEQSGINTNNVGRLRMWSNWKMKCVTFIHNDDVKCLHVAIQGTHKLVVMGRINFEDHMLIKRWWAYEKMNVMGRMFKDVKKQINHQKQFVFITGSYVHF